EAAQRVPGRPVTAYVAAGSNIDPERHLRRAIDALGERYGRVRLSGVYRNPPVGISGGRFLNLVLAFDTAEPAAAVCAELARLEKAAGRGEGMQRRGPRTLDLDLLLYGDAVIHEGAVNVPHPDIGRYD